VKLIHRERLAEFSKKHSDSEASLNAWQKNMESNSFKNFVELKNTFGSVDYLKPHVVFNISGTKYRLIGVVNYELGTVAVKDVLTHPEYDRGTWRK
jgi:mRNA interferase HigB